MKVSMTQICRDYLALRGESPELLPLLDNDEQTESAVLTLEEELKVRRPEAAIKATLQTPRIYLDELKAADVTPSHDGPWLKLRMPSDYLMLYSIRMDDWKESVTAIEPAESLRAQLGANAPAWMVCRHKPMVLQERDAEGIYLKVYGTDSEKAPLELLYVPVPAVKYGNLNISYASYGIMLNLLAGTE